MRLFRCLALFVVLFAPAALAQDAIYAVFEVENGSVQLVSASPARDTATQPVGGNGPERAEVRVLDGANALAFETSASGGALRGEFHGAPNPEGGSTIDGHHLSAERWTFAVRIPENELAMDGLVEVAVSSPTRRSAAPLRVPAADLLAQAASPARRASTVQRLFGDGDSANRIDLLVVGDGYTSAQQATFFANATSVASAFLDIPPYREYKPVFNATALFVASNQSGADQPNTGSCVGNGQVVDTAFDATYCTSNIDRLLTVNSSKVYAAAAAAPEWDLILVIVNDDKYGGAGGGLSVISMHGQAVDLARHEVGHTFGGLADEYTYGTPGSCTEPNCPPNVTPSPSRAALKWAPWVDASTPLPTPDSPTFGDDVGAFEGAFYTTTGMYRPHRNCMMRSLGVSFCPVCREHMVHRVYEGGWYRRGASTVGIDPIEPGSEQPELGGTLEIASATDFSATFLDPDGTPPLDIEWRVDDLVVSTDRAFTFAPEATGTYTVELAASDPTPMVHADRDRAFLASSRTWTVEATVSTDADETPDSRFGLLALAPNPARQLATVRYALATSGEARVEVLDAMGRRVALLANGRHRAGDHTTALRTDALAPGVYLVRLVTAEGADVLRLSVTR
ncbi:MAG: hypothetical protein Rubg2KO_30730 [Rubricoccaceae bacterium]